MLGAIAITRPVLRERVATDHPSEIFLIFECSAIASTIARLDTLATSFYDAISRATTLNIPAKHEKKNTSNPIRDLVY